MAGRRGTDKQIWVKHTLIEELKFAGYGLKEVLELTGLPWSTVHNHYYGNCKCLQREEARLQLEFIGERVREFLRRLDASVA